MYFIVFIYGIVVGSFLNVCIWRIPRKESLVFPSSHCPTCNQSLKVRDLLPLMSYIISRGKCRYCKNKVPLQYPLVELANGLLWTLAFWRGGFSFTALEYCLMASLILTISAIDLQHQIIPDELVITGLGIVFLFNVIYYIDSPEILLSSLGGGFLAGGFFLFLAVITKGGMGGGDIKLMALLGFWLGWRPILIVIFLSFLLGAIISIILMILKIKGRKDMIPFGPFIGLATLLTVFFGNDIINYYITILINYF
ncbi:prepilin peptidase [Alkaliphilus transvaalensis]|uniref:prepilin peptidase n=1 Tax=Alkaliphilus transvaalensis TaxID=114628 RepID=UPI00047B577C|nr:A24 family peptidase [Alkaliphilus transvaalensis]